MTAPARPHPTVRRRLIPPLVRATISTITNATAPATSIDSTIGTPQCVTVATSDRLKH